MHPTYPYANRYFINSPSGKLVPAVNMAPPKLLATPKILAKSPNHPISLTLVPTSKGTMIMKSAEVLKTIHLDIPFYRMMVLSQL
jgi:hypothetical protein